MSDSVKSLRNSGSITSGVIWSFLGSGLPSIVAVITIPVLIQELGTDRFGLLTLAWTIVGYFSLFDIGLGRALTQAVSEKLGTGKDREIPRVIWTSLIIMVVLGSLGTLIFACFSPFLVTKVLKIPQELFQESIDAFYLLSISIPIVISTAGVRGILFAYQEFKLVNYIRIPIGMLSYLGPILVLPFSTSLVPVVGSLVIIKLISLLIFLFFCLKKNPDLMTNIGFDRKLIAPLLSFGGWISVSSVISPLLVNIDRVVLGTFVSMTAVAYYSTPFDVVKQILMVPGALLAVLFPVFSSTYQLDQRYTVGLFQRAVKYLFIGLFPIILVIVTFAQEGLTLWVGEEFASQSYLVMQILVVGIFINSLGYVPQGLIQGSSRPDITAKLHLVELPIYLLSMVFLVSSQGIVGAAICWTGRVLLDTVLLFIMVKRIMPNQTHAQLILLSLSALAVYLAGGLIPGIWFRVGYFSTIMILFLVITWMWLLEDDERIRVKHYLRM